MVNLKAAFPVSDATDLTNKVKALEDTRELARVYKQIERYIGSNIGASEKVANIINQQAK